LEDAVVVEEVSGITVYEDWYINYISRNV
jgi:hypothetical protein